jgi:drug/metabolite transporter (DMT)-like permease
MSRKGILLFLAAGIAWGIPYFFIRIAVEHFSTESIVFGRVIIGAAILIPFAIATNALRPALKAWPWVLAFAVIEMVIPWWLIVEAERHVSSGLAGLIIATTPFYGLLIGYFVQGDKSIRHPKTIIGLIVGFVGVALLVGIDTLAGHLDVVSILMLVAAAVGYAVAPAIAAEKLGAVPTAGVMSLSMAIVAVVYAGPALTKLPAEIAANPPLEAWTAIGVLGLVCSALAFIIFFTLVREIGSARATLITYVNMAVALVLGIAFLREPITPGILIGLPMVVAGSVWASKKH